MASTLGAAHNQSWARSCAAQVATEGEEGRPRVPQRERVALADLAVEPTERLPLAVARGVQFVDVYFEPPSRAGRQRSRGTDVTEATLC